MSFNPRTYIRYDKSGSLSNDISPGFNPRTYIRYDILYLDTSVLGMFQSTYLYKVRLHYK